MKYLLITISVLLSVNMGAQSGEMEPLAVVQTFISTEKFENKSALLCCELTKELHTDSTLGQLLPKTVQRNCRLIQQDSSSACIAVWLHDSLTSRDYYFFLRKHITWQIKAIRSLTYSQSARSELLRLGGIPEEQRGIPYSSKHAHSYAFDSGNLRLWLSSDSILKDHFYTNRVAFLQLLEVLKQDTSSMISDSLLQLQVKQSIIQNQLEELLLQGSSVDRDYPRCLLFVIGGIDDNRVGYLYQPHKTKLPPVSERYYILLESLGEGWYLFKTT